MSTLCVRTSYLKLFTAEYPLTLKLNHASVLSVRWRKPRWIPKTQSKIFYVRKPTPIITEEYDMLKTKYDHYRTQMKALRSYLSKIYKEEQDAAQSKLADTEAQEDKEQFQQILAINQAWNDESSRMREERLMIEHEKKIMAAKKKEELMEKENEKIRLQSQSYITESIELSKHFITRESLDEEIEKVLDSRTNYNFSVDTKGTINKEDDNSENKQQESSG